MQIMQIESEAEQGGERSHMSKHVPCNRALRVCAGVCGCTVYVCYSMWNMFGLFSDVLIVFTVFLSVAICQ